MYFEARETQSGLGTSRTGYPVGLGDRSDWYPVTQLGTGTGASLVRNNVSHFKRLSQRKT